MITYSPGVRSALERLNAHGRLPHDALRELTAQLVEINGPMLPAAQIRLYSENEVMVAAGMVNGQYAFDANDAPWMAKVRARDGAKVLSLPESDPALIRYNRYIALRRVFKHNRRSLGVVEVIQDAANLLRGATAGSQMDVYLFNADGDVVFPVGGALPKYVREAAQSGAASGMRELDDELVAWRRSDESDWTLATVMARAAVLAPLDSLTRVTLGALALLLALSYVASRQFTRPIQALVGRMARFKAHTLNALVQGIEQVRRRGVLPSMRIGGMGLYNIAMRLKLFAGDEFLFHIQNLDGGGAQVSIGGEVKDHDGG